MTGFEKFYNRDELNENQIKTDNMHLTYWQFY